MAESERDLHTLLDKLYQWNMKWRLHVNTDKSKIMLFRKLRQKRSTTEFYIGSDILEYTDSYKYLGVDFTETLKFDLNAEILANAGGRALGALIAKFKQLKDMGYTTYTRLYESYVTPVMNYCASIWGFKKYTKSDVVQNRAM